MSAWFQNWLSKPRHWVLWLVVANFTAWAVFGLGIIELWSLLR